MRKGGKQQCLQRWIKGHYCTQADTIIAHVKWLKTTMEWLKDNGAFIPMPITYLNQQRWDGADFEPVAEKPIAKIDPALAKIEADRAKAAPMPDEIKKRIQGLLGKTLISQSQPKIEN